MQAQQQTRAIGMTNYGGTVYGTSTWYSDEGYTAYDNRKCINAILQSKNIFTEDTEVEVTLHVNTSKQYYHYFAIADTLEKIDSVNKVCTFFYAEAAGSLSWQQKEAVYIVRHTVHAGNYLYIAAFHGNIMEVTEISVKRV